MANVKFVNAAGKYQDDTARHDLIHYMTQHKKTPNHITGFSHGDISTAADQMTQTAPTPETSSTAVPIFRSADTSRIPEPKTSMPLQ